MNAQVPGAPTQQASPPVQHPAAPGAAPATPRTTPSAPPQQGPPRVAAPAPSGSAPAPHAASAPPVPSGWIALGDIIRTALVEDEAPGAVVVIGHRGRIVYRNAFGYRALEPAREPMTLGTIFDCASLTKIVATTASFMQLFERGRVRLNDPVTTYLPAFGANGKSQITVRQLLTHYSGLPGDVDLSHPWFGYDLGIEKAYATPPLTPPGSEFRYSDINFLIVGELVRTLSGEPLDQYALRHIWQPLGMLHTRFLPPAAWRPRIAPTERDPLTGVWLRGVVHDPTARYMGGVAGDAGVFSTADDLARFAQMMLNRGVLHGVRIFSPATVDKMTTPQTPFNVPEVRGLGWDIDSIWSSNRGELLPVGSYGHTGFTGTSMWIDPFTRTYIIILTNAVHPRMHGSVMSLRSKLATAIAALLAREEGWPDAASLGGVRAGSVVTGTNAPRPRPQESPLIRITGYNEASAAEHRLLYRNGVVLSGLDVLKVRDFDLLRGKRVGLVTNPTGIDRDGHRNIDDMVAAGIHVTAAFSPEHGWAGKLDTTRIGNMIDAATHVPVFSAYGDTPASRHLPEAGLRLVDTLVYDIQDAGVRFYTYETTLGYTLEDAARHHLPVIVLDRPDPIDGIHVQGPPLAQAEVSFVGYYAGEPVRTAMTVGELALMFNQGLRLGTNLQIVQMQGWVRGDYFDETGLVWTNPSPNLRTLEQEILYPGVALIEGTNVSVGRGTDTPFQFAGAPWISNMIFAAYLNARRLSGVRFIPTTFTPVSGRYASQPCQGVSIVLTDRERLDSPELGLELASALAHLYPAQWDPTEMHLLAGSQDIVNRIRRGDDPRAIADDYEAAVDAFRQIRAQYLLY